MLEAVNNFNDLGALVGTLDEINREIVGAYRNTACVCTVPGVDGTLYRRFQILEERRLNPDKKGHKV